MIEKEELRKVLNAQLQDAATIKAGFSMLRAEWEPSDENARKRADFNRQLLRSVNDFNFTAEDLEQIREESTEEGARDGLAFIYDSIERTEQFIKEDPAEYKKTVDYMTDGAELQKDTAKKIISFPFFGILWQFYTIAFNAAVKDKAGIDNEKIKASIFADSYISGATLETDENSPTVKAIINAGEDLNAYKDMAQLYNEIRARILNGQDIINRLALGDKKGELIPRRAKNDIMAISHSGYIDSLVLDGFKMNNSVYAASEQTLNSLKSEDRDILDLLTLTLYRGGIRRFTDRQIAIALYHGGNSSADVKPEELRKINESIERLRKTDIKQGIESIENIDSSKLKITETTTLINVIIRDIEHMGKTTVYDFTGVQGYFEYAEATKKQSRYSNSLISEDIKGIQHDYKNDGLRRLIVRRIAGLEFAKFTAIDMGEIYEVLEIKDPKNYPYARSKTKTIADELRGKYYNFHYEFKKQGRTTTKIIFKRDNQNPLEIATIEAEI